MVPTFIFVSKSPQSNHKTLKRSNKSSQLLLPVSAVLQHLWAQPGSYISSSLALAEGLRDAGPSLTWAQLEQGLQTLLTRGKLAELIKSSWSLLGTCQSLLCLSFPFSFPFLALFPILPRQQQIPSCSHRGPPDPRHGVHTTKSIPKAAEPTNAVPSTLAASAGRAPPRRDGDQGMLPAPTPLVQKLPFPPPRIAIDLLCGAVCPLSSSAHTKSHLQPKQRLLLTPDPGAG